MFIQRLLQRFFDTDHVLGYLNIGCFSGVGCSSEGALLRLFWPV